MEGRTVCFHRFAERNHDAYVISGKGTRNYYVGRTVEHYARQSLGRKGSA